MGQIKYITSLAFITLFTISILFFSSMFANDTGASVRLSQSDSMGSLEEGILGNMSEFSNSSTDTYTSILQTEVSTGGTTSRSGSQYSLSIADVYNSLKTIMIYAPLEIFGDTEEINLFRNIFLGVMILIAGLYVIKTWIGGNPD